MGLLLHIQILEYLQQNNADGGLTDIKPAFEKHLDSMPKRKEMKAELDYLLDSGLATSTSRFDFLNWELLTGLYPLDKKKLELAITAKGMDYLQLQTTPRFTVLDATTADEPPVSDPNSFEPPETVLPYPKPEENEPVPTAQVPVVHSEPVAHIAVPEPEPLPVAQFVTPEVVTAAPVPATVKKPAPAPLAPQPIAARQNTVAMPVATEQDTEPVILTARNNRALNKTAEAPVYKPVEYAPQPAPAPVPEKQRTLKSISELPPGPVSLGSAPGVTKTAFKTREAKIIANNNSPFAALEVIPLAPMAGKEKKKIDTATLLRWAVVAVAFILIVLLYLIFKKRY